MLHTKRPPIDIDQDSIEVFENFSKKDVIILCGRNNSGKTFLLKSLYGQLGEGTSFLGPNRYQNFSILNNINGNRNKSQEYQNRVRNLENSAENVDNSPWNLNQAIAELGNDKRKKLFKILGDLLESEIDIQFSDPNNDMSQKFVSVDGYNFSFTSSGFRLVASILTSLLDSDYKYFIIDEPELGISPEIQGALAEFLLDDLKRKEFFPHLEKLIIATHSPVFIDKTKISRNYYIARNDYKINIKPTSTIQEINSLQFFLLGNRFETLFLPSIILLVEGKCDYKFLSQLLKKRYPDQNISIIQCNGDSKIGLYVNLAKNMFGNLNKSPYHNRIITVIDKIHGFGLKSKLIAQGIPEQNIVVWDKNGIEYYYPSSLMTKIFGEFDQLEINGDIVSANGVNKKKNELVEELILLMNGNEDYSEEFNSKFLKRISSLIY